MGVVNILPETHPHIGDAAFHVGIVEAGHRALPHHLDSVVAIETKASSDMHRPVDVNERLHSLNGKLVGTAPGSSEDIPAKFVIGNVGQGNLLYFFRGQVQAVRFSKGERHSGRPIRSPLSIGQRRKKRCKGARPGELAKVEARHFEEGLWRLDPSEHKTGRVTGKDRLIGVADNLHKIVKRLSKLYPVGPIFRNTFGRKWTSSAMHVLFEPARAEKIIREEVVPYSFRHAWATHALESGRLDVYEVAKALGGHQTIQMVTLHYDHSRNNTAHMKEIIERARRGKPVNQDGTAKTRKRSRAS